MGRMRHYLASSVGKKQLMAITGLGLSLFVLLHMAGNIIVLISPQKFNAYGHAIVTNPFLYVAEAGLLGIFLLHICLALNLTWENQRARPVKYAASPRAHRGGITVAAKSLIYSGLLLLVFVVIHLKTFKFGPYYEVQYDGVAMRDLHKLIVEVYSDPLHMGWYVFALLVLGLHLSHGVKSTLQSLGANHPAWNPTAARVSYAFVGIVTLGFLAIPLAIFFLRDKL